MPHPEVRSDVIDTESKGGGEEGREREEDEQQAETSQGLPPAEETEGGC